MLIACPSCKKNFDVDHSLIPDQGRLLQCGFCNHKWFYKNNKISEQVSLNDSNPSIKISSDLNIPKDTEIIIKQAEEEIRKPIEKKIDVSRKKSNVNTSIIRDQNIIGDIFSYIIVTILSFIALIILLDTFKSPLTNIFPKLDYFLLSLYETLKDIELFIIDLI